MDGCTSTMTHQSISSLARDVLQECSSMESECLANGIQPPSLDAGAKHDFWLASSQLAASRSKATGLLQHLNTLIQGPHEYLHEFVAPSWDHGALYAFLQSQALDCLAASPGGKASLHTLSEKSGIPEDKLVRILALLRCRHIVCEPDSNVYALTAVSEELAGDAGFRAWVEFQLYETRVASAHLTDSLISKPNGYTDGTSGFKRGWGMEMYDWHAQHPKKGDRFRRAMRGVSESLDPADELLAEWLSGRDQPGQGKKIVELGGRYGFASLSLADKDTSQSFEVRCDNPDFLDRGKAAVKSEDSHRISFTWVAAPHKAAQADDTGNVSAYLIRNLLWNWSDDDAVELLRSLLPTLTADPSVSILVTDGVSPQSREFPPHVEIAYRRRDITTMTMHNVKQRSQVEWHSLFERVHPAIKIRTNTRSSSHVYKGLWELSLV